MDLDQVQEIIDRIGSDSPPTDDELREARAALREALQVAREPDATGRIDLDAIKALRKSYDKVRDELTERDEARENERSEAERLLQGIDAEDEDEDDEPVEEPTAAGDEPAGEPETAEPEPVEPKAREPVAASIDLRTAGQRLRKRRAASRNGGDDIDNGARVDVIVAGPGAGDKVPATYDDAVELFNRRSHLVTRGRQTLLELQYHYPTTRTLTKNAGVNTSVVEGFLRPRATGVDPMNPKRPALIASGGICDPLPADFDHPICGDRARPIRDALPRFSADRGGVRFAPAASLGDVSAGTGVWTESRDLSPGTFVKNCLVITCKDEVEVKVDAIYRCLEIGNFAAKFNPEFWQSRLDLLMVAHDRLAEQTLFATMRGLATDVAVPNVDGNTAQTLFVGLAMAAAGIRSRNRLLRSTVLRFLAPDWLRDAIVASLVRGQIDNVDLLTIADATINSFFSSRNILPIWSPDINVFGTQTAGALLDWANTQTATTILFPEGTFFYLDGGTLDLGINITDSSLNSTNDRQAFAESFEQVAFRGCQALELAIPVGEDCVCATTTT
jgi:hypothetical protein